MDRISITCTIRAIDERLKDKMTGEKEKVSFTVEAKVELLEKDGERIGIKKAATMLAVAPTLDEAQSKAIALAKAELGV